MQEVQIEVGGRRCGGRSLHLMEGRRAEIASRGGAAGRSCIARRSGGRCISRRDGRRQLHRAEWQQVEVAGGRAGAGGGAPGRGASRRVAGGSGSAAVVALTRHDRAVPAPQDPRNPGHRRLHRAAKNEAADCHLRFRPPLFVSAVDQDLRSNTQKQKGQSGTEATSAEGAIGEDTGEAEPSPFEPPTANIDVEATGPDDGLPAISPP